MITKRRVIVLVLLICAALALLVVWTSNSVQKTNDPVRVTFIGFTNVPSRGIEVLFNISNAGPTTVELVGTEFVCGQSTVYFTGWGPRLSPGETYPRRLPAPTTKGMCNVVVGYYIPNWRQKLRSFAATHHCAHFVPISWASVKSTNAAAAFLNDDPLKFRMAP